MEKMVVITTDEAFSSDLYTFQKFLFPECEIGVVSRNEDNPGNFQSNSQGEFVAYGTKGGPQ